MNLKRVFDEIKIFSETTHGSSQFNKDVFFVKGNGIGDFAPLKYLEKKVEGMASGLISLLKHGFICDSYELYEMEDFQSWFERQFSRKMTKVIAKKIFIIYRPDEKIIFGTIAQLNTCYQTFRSQKILLTSKKLPVQLGEWYARCIFGLTQNKSSSQRGFDFQLDGRRIEVKIDWGDDSSPKGVKVRKTLLEYSDYLIVIYVAFNFMIREICYLDSQFKKIFW